MPNPQIDPHAVNAMFKNVDKPADKPAEPAPVTEADKVAIDTMTADLPNLLWGNKKKEPPKEEPPKEPAKIQEPPKEPAATDTPPADPPKDPPKPKKAKKPDVDPLEIAKTVGESIASRMQQNQPAPATPPAADPTSFMSEDDRYSYTILQEMAENEPEKYKGKPQEFLEYAKEFEKYKSKWETANPGETFDMEADDHAAFFEKHEPDFNDADFRRAEARLEYKRVHQKERQELEERIRKAEMKATIPQVHSEAVDKAEETVGIYLSKVLPKEGDKSVDLAKLKDTDPLTHDVISAYQKELGEVTTEIHKIAKLGGDYFDPQNKIHKNISDFIVAQEKQIKGLATHDQVSDGKMFATMAEYAGMTDKDRAKHWTLEEEDIISMTENFFAKLTEKTVETEKNKLKSFAEKYGYTPKGSQSQASPSQEPAAPAVQKPVSPSGGGGGVNPPTAGGKAPEVKDLSKALVSSLFGK